VSHTSDAADVLQKLLQQLERQYKSVAEAERSDIDELIYSFLLYDNVAAKADTGLRKLREATVDDNDLRVTLTPDLVKIIGERFPKAAERIERLRASLNEIYMREYEVSLEPARDKSKRDARVYLESLEGMLPFVAARVLLLRFGGHAIPLDEQLLTLLIDRGVFEPDTDLLVAQSFLERQIKAADALTTYLRLQAWSEDNRGGKGRSKSGGTRKKQTSAS
jgi:endonuclease III